MDMTRSPSDALFVLMSFIPFLFTLALLVFGVYFVIKVIRFMNAKVKLDREKNEKLTEIIKLLKQDQRL